MKRGSRRKAKSPDYSGVFLTFEGGEGAGKTTQIAKLAQEFERRGHSVVVTREPGGSTIANRIRSLLLDSRMHGLVPLAELFLYEASRAQHIHDTILPALKKGKVVICDRFADSSLVYQGVARKLPPAVVQKLNDLATDGLTPNRTFLLDLDPRIGLARVGARGVLDRMEKEALSFHRAVRHAYLALVEKNKKRFYVVDASQSRDAIHAAVMDGVQEFLE